MKQTPGSFATPFDTDLTISMTRQFLKMKRKIMSGNKRNDEVVEAWLRGEKACSHNGNLRSDGVNLFSYNLRIGYRAKSGTTVAADYTSPGGSFQSMTTSCHVGKVRWRADHVMHPTVFENSVFPE